MKEFDFDKTIELKGKVIDDKVSFRRLRSEKRKNLVNWGVTEKFLAVSAAITLSLIIIAAIFADLITKFHFSEIDVDNILASPSQENFFGTDFLGRDIFSRVLQGARVSLSIGIVSSIFGVLFGSMTGAFSALSGGWFDRLIMRFIDILWSIPTIIVLLLLSMLIHEHQIFENSHFSSFWNVTLAFTFVSSVGLSRQMRAEALKILQEPFIEAAVSLGASRAQIVFRHLLPNMRNMMLTLFGFQVSYNILSESFLSFIGLGVQPPMTSWGLLASEGWSSFATHPHAMLFPCLIIFISMLSLNLLGDLFGERKGV